MFYNELEAKLGCLFGQSLTLKPGHSCNRRDRGSIPKEGPVSVAKFKLGEDVDRREAGALRQREVAEIAQSLLGAIDLEQ